jgi:coenzyme F420-dependent glucose-6-phosphate dehydrogenase
MTAFGYALSGEEHGPSDLVRNAATAEELGFDFCSVSDHFHPWVEAQGHSPFVWSALGAMSSVTERMEFVTGVTCPIIRTHPVIIAHASATTSLLMGDRFTLGVGTGEALNEHVHGDRWPRPEVRLAMLEEAVEIIRRLWSGDTVDHAGTHYEVENARLFDAPSTPPLIAVSGYGPQAMKLAGRIGDAFFSHGGDDSAVPTYQEAGGSGPTYAQLNLCIGPDAEECKRIVHQQWPNSAVPGQLSQDLPTWTHFEQAASLVEPGDAVEGMPHGPDVEPVVEKVKSYLANGFDHVYFHQIGPDQQPFFDAWNGELGAAVRALDS